MAAAEGILGFEEVESPNFFGEFKVIWLRLPSSSVYIHLIERDPTTSLPEGPWSANSTVVDPNLPSGHHICFSVSNFNSFVATLKGIETFERSIPNGKIKQVFFFDPDGNGLEVASREEDS
ncbi:hypothetical protein PIB30_003252 [Stylosanthes scabra]|uniref:Lactoylglutathione lyase n=1 Tax=Stylosanthes scabra TaxID=79078 RepID=A0ABU6R4S7_9FABA|nr:hypothetical protein [Stylosanthes scabra]